MDLILRDKLAIDRTHLANERTLMAYLRTSLYLIVFSLVVFTKENLNYLSVPLLISLIIAIVGYIRYYKVKKRIKSLYK